MTDVEGLYREILNWSSEERGFLAWVAHTAAQMGEQTSFAFRVEVMRRCTKEEHRDLSNIYDRISIFLTFEEMKKFLLCPRFCNWFDQYKEIETSDEFVINLMLFAEFMPAVKLEEVENDLLPLFAQFPEIKVKFLTLKVLFDNRKGD